MIIATSLRKAWIKTKGIKFKYPVAVWLPLGLSNKGDNLNFIFFSYQRGRLNSFKPAKCVQWYVYKQFVQNL